MASNKKTTDRTITPPALRLAFRAADALSPALAAALAAPLFLHTRRHPVREREREVLQGGERHHLATDRGRAVAWVWGRPAPAATAVPTVFLTHGWEGRGAQLGAFVEPLRRAGLRVVAFDAPGHGEAPGNSSSLVALGAALEAAAARWQPIVGLVAHSAGAIGATWALSRGLAPRRVVFVAPGSDLLGYTSRFGALFGLGTHTQRRLARRIEDRIGVTYDELEPLDRAPEMTVPMLAFSDRSDTETGLETVERLVAAWPGAELRVTQGLGHRRILWEPDVVDAAVGFLTGTEGAAATESGESSSRLAGVAP